MHASRATCLALPFLKTVLSAMDADTAVGKLATGLRLRLFDPVSDPNSVRGSYGSVEAGLMYIKARERVRDKLPYVWHLVGTSFQASGVARDTELSRS